MRIDFAKCCAVALLSTILVLVGIAYAVLAAALPRRDGELTVTGLSAALEIDLDARAIPRIRATSFADALRGQGYMHAQERFFQMDLLRRSAAGELAELFGERALAADRGQRPFRFRARARALLERLPAEHVEWLAAYTQGVNAGLADLRARPPEYWLFGAVPTRWRSEDSLLVVFSFYTMLSNNDSYERPQGVLHATLPAPLYEFLTPSTSRFDRPLFGTADADPTGGYAPLPIPGPEIIDLRTTVQPDAGSEPRIDPPLLGPASNQWAVDATRSATGHSILANDPHLGLRVPNIFYRCELEWDTGVVRGASVPGLPGVLIGANNTLAWGATVSNADQSDWVVVETDADDPSRYRATDGLEPFVTSTEDIAVAGRAAPERLEIRSTRWGPIVARDWLGRPLALRATWLEPSGLDLSVLELAREATVADGAAMLERWAGPSLNWMLADATGAIGWVVNGPLPRRIGFDGSRPESWADGSRAWQDRNEVPLLLGHSSGALFTANNRTLPPSRADALSRMWMRPLRAKRIDDLLASRATFAERDFLSMQLDTRAEGYDAIAGLVLEVVAEGEREELLVRAREHVRRWNGSADVEQVGFRLLHAYYRALLERALTPLLAAAAAYLRGFTYRLGRWERRAIELFR
jgi:penicillin amidase